VNVQNVPIEIDVTMATVVITDLAVTPETEVITESVAMATVREDITAATAVVNEAVTAAADIITIPIVRLTVMTDQ